MCSKGCGDFKSPSLARRYRCRLATPPKTGGERAHKMLSKFDPLRASRVTWVRRPEMVQFCMFPSCDFPSWRYPVIE